MTVPVGAWGLLHNVAEQDQRLPGRGASTRLHFRAGVLEAWGVEGRWGIQGADGKASLVVFGPCPWHRV